LAVLSGAGAVIVESTMGICASVFGDPFPSIAHFVSVTLVPVTIAVNTVVSLRGKEPGPGGIKALSVMNCGCGTDGSASEAKGIADISSSRCRFSR
jgi:hypothetical protein